MSNEPHQGRMEGQRSQLNYTQVLTVENKRAAVKIQLLLFFRPICFVVLFPLSASDSNINFWTSSLRPWLFFVRPHPQIQMVWALILASGSIWHINGPVERIPLIFHHLIHMRLFLSVCLSAGCLLNWWIDLRAWGGGSSQAVSQRTIDWMR